MIETTRLSLSRRDVLVLVGVAGVALGIGGRARPAFATPEAALDFLKKATPGGEPKEGRITLKAPEIAENGNTVPITITVESPMTDQDHVKRIAVVAEANPSPGVATFDISPANGKAQVEFRIRLAQTQKVVAVAQMSDGSLWQAAHEIKVTIGGCGG
jgi:sulfur-oxidizing protein SoxY